MFDKLASEENRYEELSRLLSTAEVQADPNEMRKHAKALAELEPLVEKFREYKVVASEIAQAEEMVGGSDADMRELAKEELKSLTARRDTAAAALAFEFAGRLQAELEALDWVTGEQKVTGAQDDADVCGWADGVAGG